MRIPELPHRTPALRLIAMLAVILSAGSLAGEEMRFPDDPRAILNVKSECGAVGDGVADDSEALQKAIETSYADGVSRFVYLPNGVYKITRELVFRPKGSDGKEGSMVGPWIYGQHRDKAIIRLAAKTAGFTDPGAPKAMIRGVSRPDGSGMNADFFDRTLVNLTLDAGDNPGAIGIKFYSNNTGIMRQVAITGNGVCGLDLGFNDQNGPLLIQDVDIKGFKTGVSTANGINSQTLCRIRVSGAEVGLRHRQQVMAVEGLEVVGAVSPVTSEGGALSLIGCRFDKGPGSGAAVTVPGDKVGNLYIRDLVAKGYAKGVQGGGINDADGAPTTLAEFSSKPVQRPDPAGKGMGLMLKAPPEPEVPWENDPKRWVCANDFGMTSGSFGPVDDDDDGTAIQKAIDEAAKTKATTVYIIGGRGGDPNWYHVRSDVRIHGSVRRVIGIGFVRILNGHKNLTEDKSFPDVMPKFIVADEGASTEAVAIEHLNVFAPRPGFCIEVRATKRPVVVRSCTPVLIAKAKSRVFMTNTVSMIFMEPGSNVVARHLNSEGGGVNNANDGGKLWVLGFKTERNGTKILTKGGGDTEVFGTLNYNTTGDTEKLPFFDVQDSRLFSGGYQEVNFGGSWYGTSVRLRSKGAEHVIGRQDWMNWAAVRAGG